MMKTPVLVFYVSLASLFNHIHAWSGWNVRSRALIGRGLRENRHLKLTEAIDCRLQTKLAAAKSDDDDDDDDEVNLDLLKRELTEYLEKRKEAGADELAKG
jgi:hypothetical protein